MNRQSPLAGITREQRRQLDRDNARFPLYLVQQPRDGWSYNMLQEPRLIEVWRSREFLMQVFLEEGGIVRLSVNRTSVDWARMRWAENITWDELQLLKAQCGRAHLDAVEVYPREADVVDVANLRHLWVLPELVPFAWRRP